MTEKESAASRVEGLLNGIEIENLCGCDACKEGMKNRKEQILDIVRDLEAKAHD